MRTGNEAVSRSVVITLRRATLEDAPKLLEWRNDPDVRAVSESPEPITMRDHMTWLAERLPFTHNESVWVVLSEDETPVGSVRVLLEGSTHARLSIVIGEEYRNHGFGRATIKTIKGKVESMKRVALAKVHGGNLRSLRVFTDNGFHVDLVQPKADAFIQLTTARQLK